MLSLYEQLLQHNGPFAQFLHTYLLNDDISDEETDPESKSLSKIRKI